MDQDWFEEKAANAAIADFWSLQRDHPDEGEVVMATKTEAKNINAEKDLLAMAPPGFQVWWFRAYGNRLLKDGEVLYVPYLRVALEAWRAALTPAFGTSPEEKERNNVISKAVITHGTQPATQPAKPEASKPERVTDDDVSF